MLLNKMCGRRLSAISLCLAVTFAPLFNAQADEPEMIPGDSSATVSEQPTALSARGSIFCDGYHGGYSTAPEGVSVD